jgi:flagellar hook-associated protein 3 FlgL
MSENEDIDMVETIMSLQNEENVYKASLSGGARIIQPSLVDFLR